MTTISPNLKAALFDNFKKELQYNKRVREIIGTPVGINTPITEANKDAVLNARKIAAKETGYEPMKISILGLGNGCGEDVYGNPIYSPYQYPVSIF